MLDRSLRGGAATSAEVSALLRTTSRNQKAVYQCWLHLDSRSGLRPTSLFFRPYLYTYSNAKDGPKMFTLSTLAAKESDVEYKSPLDGRNDQHSSTTFAGHNPQDCHSLGQLAYALSLRHFPVLA